MAENLFITITLPDGSTREIERGTTVLQVAESIGSGLARAALAGRVDGRAVDLSYPVASDAAVEILTFSNDEAKRFTGIAQRM